MVWHSHLLTNFPQFVVIHTVKGDSMVNEAEVDVFLEFYSDSKQISRGSCSEGESYTLSCTLNYT